jgi:hypothetical protein
VAPEFRASLLGAALVMAAAQPAAAAQLAALSGAERDGSFEFIFRQPGAAQGETEIHEHEIVIRFPQQLPDEIDRELQTVLGPWIDSASMGYDSVVLHFARRVRVTGERRGTAFVVTLVPLAAPASTEASAGSSRRLALVNARALAASGEVAAARQQLAALRQSDPSDPAPVTQLAGIEQQGGRWRLAGNLYRDALQLDPSDDESHAALAAIERAQASRLRLDFDYREIQGAERVYTTRFSFYTLIGEGWRSGAALETAYITTPSVLRETGQSLPFEGVRNRGEAFLQYDFLDGEILRGTAYAGMQAGGAGLDWQRPDDRGQTALHGEVARPNWDFIDGEVNGLTRNRVSLARQQTLSPAANARVELGANRYDLPNLGDVGSSGTVAAEFRYTPITGPRDIGVAYTLDGEYPWHVQSQLDGSGTAFHSLSLVKREVHALSGTYAEDLFEAPAADHSLLLEAFGGWGIDRFGRPGPLYGTTLTLNQGALQAQLRGSQVRHIGRDGESATLVGGALMWLF